MILKITCDVFVKVDAVVARHVVFRPGISEKVGVGAGIGTGAEERQGVLGHADGVVVAEDDEQTSFQVAGPQTSSQ